ARSVRRSTTDSEAAAVVDRLAATGVWRAAALHRHAVCFAVGIWTRSTALRDGAARGHLANYRCDRSLDSRQKAGIDEPAAAGWSHGIPHLAWLVRSAAPHARCIRSPSAHGCRMRWLRC